MYSEWFVSSDHVMMDSLDQNQVVSVVDHSDQLSSPVYHKMSKDLLTDDIRWYLHVLFCDSYSWGTDKYPGRILALSWLTDEHLVTCGLVRDACDDCLLTGDERAGDTEKNKNKHDMGYQTEKQIKLTKCTHHMIFGRARRGTHDNCSVGGWWWWLIWWRMRWGRHHLTWN